MLCSGVAGEINLLTGSIPPEARIGHTGIDQLLNAAAKDNLGSNRAVAIASIITKIEGVCRGWRRTPQGFYVPEGD